MKFLAASVDDEFHQMVKIYVLKKHTNIKDYLINLVKKDMEENAKENE